MCDGGVGFKGEVNNRVRSIRNTNIKSRMRLYSSRTAVLYSKMSLEVILWDLATIRPMRWAAEYISKHSETKNRIREAAQGNERIEQTPANVASKRKLVSLIIVYLSVTVYPE